MKKLLIKTVQILVNLSSGFKVKYSIPTFFLVLAIRAKAPACPVLIVGTHLDACNKSQLEKARKIIQEKYQSRFQQIAYVAEVDARKAKNLEDVVEVLTELSQHLINPGSKYFYSFHGNNDLATIAKSWMLCEEAIVKERKKQSHGIISWTEFTEIAMKVGIPVLAIPRAASFLHEVGVMLWFEEKNSGTFPTIFLT